MIRSSLLVLSSLLLPLAAAADGQHAPSDSEPARTAGDPKDEIPRPPPTYKGNDVTVDERLMTQVPLDVRFRRHDGNVVTLRDVLAGDLPTILTFNYSNCPMLCNLQLNGLTSVLPQLAERKDGALFWAGEQFRIVTISLDPDEDLERLTRMRTRYLERIPEQLREDARGGWTFLAAEFPGDPASIRRVAEAVGFRYTYIKDRAEWAHPASLIFLSTRGVVTRYVHGIEFSPDVMRESLLRAGAAEPSTAVGFMNRCYHYDPNANNHSRAGVLALRVAAAGFVVLLLSALGVMHVVRRNRPLHEVKGNRS